MFIFKKDWGQWKDSIFLENNCTCFGSTIIMSFSLDYIENKWIISEKYIIHFLKHFSIWESVHFLAYTCRQKKSILEIILLIWFIAYSTERQYHMYYRYVLTSMNETFPQKKLNIWEKLRSWLLTSNTLHYFKRTRWALKCHTRRSSLSLTSHTDRAKPRVPYEYTKTSPITATVHSSQSTNKSPQ